MSRDLAVRALGLYVPIAIAGALWWWRAPDRRLGAAALVAAAWTAPSLLAVNLVAQAAGWWSFNAAEATLAGVPVDLYLGWIVLWSLVPVLAAPASFPIPAIALALVWIDLLLMPLCAPVVSLHASWLYGEAAAALVVLVPALYLARWTLTRRHLAVRAAMQVVAFAALVLFVMPSIVFAQAGGSWRVLVDRPGWVTALLLQLIAIPAVVGVSAVQEFAARGGGTPIPYDPPAHLVTTGPYAYVANPMQLSASAVLVGWAALLQSWWVLAGSAIALAYSAGLAAWHEDAELRVRFGFADAWPSYRRLVARWQPRWRPPVMHGAPALLYVAESCDLCSDVARWIARRKPINLHIVAAERAPRELRRITYVGQRCEEDGVAAFARALEHVNLAWAWIGMVMRLPGVRQALQILVDGSGGYARPLNTRRSDYCASRPAFPGAPASPDTAAYAAPGRSPYPPRSDRGD